MDRLISQQAAIDAIRNEFKKSPTTAIRTMEVLKGLPSAQQWIPCSERMPEMYGQYLVTFIPSGGTLWTCVLIARYSDLMGMAKPSFHVGTVGKNDFMNITEQVVAWMPLPAPYEERREK